MKVEKIVRCLHQGEEGIPQDYGDCYNCIPNEKNKECSGPYVPVISYVFYVFSREEIELRRRQTKTG